MTGTFTSLSIDLELTIELFINLECDAGFFGEGDVCRIGRCHDGRIRSDELLG